MQIMDPENVRQRGARQMKRRVYSSKVWDSLGVEDYRLIRILYFVQGPNHVWHIDQYDKLSKYGFCLHGCIDGWVYMHCVLAVPQMWSYA